MSLRLVKFGGGSVARRGQLLLRLGAPAEPAHDGGRGRQRPVLLVAADGRQAGRSAGLSILEAARVMRALGAVRAMNLDGGGSTTMVLEGEVVNHPSDPSGERADGDAVLVKPRRRSR